MTPEPKTLERIAEGQRAGIALDTFGSELDRLIENCLREADRAVANGALPERYADGLLHRICSYRRIKTELRNKETVGQRASAALVAEQTDADEAPGH